MATQDLIVIPARMGSTRFPGKPMADILGTSMLERVWRIACQTQASEVVISTDDNTLKAFAEGFGAQVVMTSKNCPTGTDRVAETIKQINKTYDVVFSFQGDAVLTPPWIIDDVLKSMHETNAAMATPAVKLQGKALTDFVASKKAGSTTGTSVVFDKNHQAMYFSKGLIPHCRDANSPEYPVYRHIGLYAYQPDTLLKLLSLEMTPLEKCEKLEQLRALENGIAIQVVPVNYRGRTHGSVDSPEDIDTVVSIIKQEGELVL